MKVLDGFEEVAGMHGWRLGWASKINNGCLYLFTAAAADL